MANPFAPSSLLGLAQSRASEGPMNGLKPRVELCLPPGQLCHTVPLPRGSAVRLLLSSLSLARALDLHSNHSPPLRP